MHKPDVLHRQWQVGCTICDDRDEFTTRDMAARWLDRHTCRRLLTRRYQPSNLLGNALQR